MRESLPEPGNDSSSKFKKPRLSDRSRLEAELSMNEISTCGICFHENDLGDSDDILWFQCSSCSILIHVTCEPDFDIDLLICSNCRKS